MSPFDNIIEDVADRFGLGAKAGPLLHELLMLITNTPGGISGFIDKFRSAGLSQASGWLGNADAAPLSASQVERALGSHAVNTIARKVGVSNTAASEAIGYLTPKVIGKMTPNGVVGSGLPSWVSDFLRSSGAHLPERTIPDAAVASRASASPARWIAPLLALLAALGLGSYFLANRTAEPIQQQTSTPTPPSTPAPSTQAQSTPAPSTSAPAATAQQSRLAITNDNGVINVSGTVRDDTTRNSIMDMMKSVFGDNAVKGNITVDPNAAPMPWLASLRNGLEQLKTPGVHAVFSGSSINLGGTMSDPDRQRILSSLRSVFGTSDINVEGMDQISNLVSASTNKAMTALASLGSGFQPSDLLGVLNKSIINFPTGSAQVPAMSQSLLEQAAAKFKELPDGTTVEIGGYTDNTGDPNANLKLSQERAEAVRNTLVQAGVNPGMLVAKGYGSANPIASNDTAEGRFQNRRIEYQVANK